ncbi:MAG: sigma-70 family RNA polymerase sigma factor [Verrucomicrobiota bacterium JB023]|nr:sigma-70 family RNA polymerase sigma factor [Verrucomicrobiota bacterium JB023]
MIGQSDVSKEVELVSRARAGDARAYVELVERYQGLVSAVTLSVLADRTLSEDAAQEAFLSAWKALPNLREPSKFRPWLTAIARRAALKGLSMRAQRADDELTERADQRLGPDEMAARGDDLAFVLSSLKTLPEAYRTPLILFYREGHSVAKVAESLGMKPSAVKQRLKRGREMLRDKVESRLSSALRRTAPGTAFTAAVAAALGQMGGAGSAAAAGLGEVFVTSGSSAATTSVVTGATMTTSKFSAITATVLLAAGLPLGYGASKLMQEAASSSQLAGSRTTPHEVTLDELRGRPLPPSRVVDEWRRLVAKHGKAPSSMAGIRDEVETFPDGFLKDALTTTLFTTWVRIDPEGGFTVLSEDGDWPEKYLFTEEWIKADASRAMEAIVSSGNENWITSTGKILGGRDPNVFSDYLEQFNFKIGLTTGANRGLERAAELAPHRILEAALAMDEGEAKGGVLNAAIKGWAKREPQDALAWIQENPSEDGIVQRDRLFSIVNGWTEKDADSFLKALPKLLKGELPEGWMTKKELRTRWVTMALAKVAKDDFPKAIRYLGENRDDLRFESVAPELNQLILERMAVAPRETLVLLEMEGLMNEGERIFSNLSYSNKDFRPNFEELCETLHELGESKGKKALVQSLSMMLVRQSEEDAVKLVDSAAHGKNYEQLKDRVVSSLMRNDVTYKRLIELERKFPHWANNFKSHALEENASGFRRYPGQPRQAVELSTWIPVFEELMESGYYTGYDEYILFRPVFGLGPAYLAQDPDAAIRWMNEVTEGAMKESLQQDLLGQTVASWMGEESEQALTWLHEQDWSSWHPDFLGSVCYEATRLKGEPHLFWELFASIEGEERRQSAIWTLQENRDAQQIRMEMDGLNLTPAERQEIDRYLNVELIEQ